MTRTRGTMTSPAVQIAELEQLLEHLSRLGAKRAALLALLDDELQLLGRVVLLGVVRLAIDAEQLQHQVAERRSAPTTNGYRAFSHPQHRRRDPAAPSAPHCCSASDFGTISPTTMWKYVRIATATTLATPCETSHAGRPRAAEQRVEPVGQRVLAVHAEAEAGDGDAELRRGDVAILLLRIVEHALDAPREPVALRGPPLDRGARRADDRELRRDEDPVQHDERRR